MSGLVGAIALLTRIPVGADRQSPRALASSVPWFPIVGAGVGLTIAVAYAAGAAVLPSFVAAVLAVAAGTLLTGAFHEDALGDVADAFGGGATIERRLEILDDPRHGTFGVMAIGTALLVRVGALGSIDVVDALVLMPSAHAISRAAAIGLMRGRPLVPPSGMGASYAASLTAREGTVGVVAGIVICGALIGVWTLPAAAACAMVAFIMGALAKAKVGGIGGDVLGATQQVAELAVLSIGAAVVHEGWADLAWWLR